MKLVVIWLAKSKINYNRNNDTQLNENEKNKIKKIFSKKQKIFFEKKLFIIAFIFYYRYHFFELDVRLPTVVGVTEQFRRSRHRNESLDLLFDRCAASVAAASAIDDNARAIERQRTRFGHHRHFQVELDRVARAVHVEFEQRRFETSARVSAEAVGVVALHHGVVGQRQHAGRRRFVRRRFRRFELLAGQTPRQTHPVRDRIAHKHVERAHQHVATLVQRAHGTHHRWREQRVVAERPQHAFELPRQAHRRELWHRQELRGRAERVTEIDWHETPVAVRQQRVLDVPIADAEHPAAHVERGQRRRKRRAQRQECLWRRRQRHDNTVQQIFLPHTNKSEKKITKNSFFFFLVFTPWYSITCLIKIKFNIM